MTVMLATFGALPGVQFMHAIFHFEAQEVNNPMLQTVHDSELKWRSYSHWKPITPSWRKNFARLRNHPFAAKWFRSTVLWNSSWSFPIFATRWKPNTASWKPTSQRCEIISQPFLSVCEISQTSFSSAKWSLVLPDICDRHFWIFCFRFFYV